MSISKFLKAVSISCLTIASCSIGSIAQAAPSLIELTYLASQIQCGAAGELIDVEVDVYNDGAFVQTLSVDDTVYLPITSFEDLDFQYSVNSLECTPIATPIEEVLAPGDDVPAMPGAYEQASLQDMLNNLNDYEELFVVELGTTEPTDPMFDLQDVVMVINNQVYSD